MAPIVLAAADSLNLSPDRVDSFLFMGKLVLGIGSLLAIIVGGMSIWYMVSANMRPLRRPSRPKTARAPPSNGLPGT